MDRETVSRLRGKWRWVSKDSESARQVIIGGGAGLDRHLVVFREACAVRTY